MSVRFHSQDGLCFSRVENGSVTVELVADGAQYATAEPTFKTTLDASLWASIVSSMSADGENFDTWSAALKAQGKIS